MEIIVENDPLEDKVITVLLLIAFIVGLVLFIRILYLDILVRPHTYSLREYILMFLFVILLYYSAKAFVVHVMELRDHNLIEKRFYRLLSQNKLSRMTFPAADETRDSRGYVCIKLDFGPDGGPDFLVPAWTFGYHKRYSVLIRRRTYKLYLDTVESGGKVVFEDDGCYIITPDGTRRDLDDEECVEMKVIHLINTKYRNKNHWKALEFYRKVHY